MMSDGERGCEGNMICVSYVYQLSQSLVPPPVASDKLTILFMPALPFPIITVQIFFLGSPPAGCDGPETMYLT